MAKSSRAAYFNQKVCPLSPSKLQSRVALLLPFVVLVVLHILAGLRMEQPLILSDEVGYLGNARYLAGTAPLPNMQAARFYHFGYSLLILPAFWLFSDPISIYRAAVVINALVISSLYFLLYSLLTTFLDVPKKTASWIAFACGLYPAFMLYSNFAWADTAFVAFVALTTLLFGRFLRSRSTSDLLLFSCATGFLYTIHPRALPVLGILLIYLLAMAVLKVLSKGQALLSATTIGLILTITRVVNEHLKAVGWLGAGEYSVARMAGRLLPGSAFLLLIQRSMGQLLYLCLASYGLFLVGFTAAIWYVLERLSSGSPRSALADPRVGVRIFMLMTAGGVFFASLSVKLYSTYGGDGIRGAGFIPGRYNEAFAALFIALALAEICQSRLDTSRFVRRSVAVMASLMGLAALVSSQIGTFLTTSESEVVQAPLRQAIPVARVNALEVPGVFPLVHLLGGLNLYLVALAAIAAYLAITTMMRYSTRGALLLLMLLFAWSALYNHRHYLRPIQERARPRLTFALQASRLGPIESISFDRSRGGAGLLYGSQYLLPNTKFDLFKSRIGEEPGSKVVIAGTDWRQATDFDAELVLQEGNGRFGLWVLPGELQERLPPAEYAGIRLGAEPVFRIQESGFHAQEWVKGDPARWTNGAAKLRVPIESGNPPRSLEIETVAFGRDRVVLQVMANGVELWNQQIPPAGWSKSFDLEQVPLGDTLLIELNSDTLTPSDGPGGPPLGRSLGVMVKGIHLWTSSVPQN